VILVLSQDSWDVTTEEVQDWIEALGGDCVRLNGEDLNGGGSFTLTCGCDGLALLLNLGGRIIDLQDIGAVWARRWHSHQNLSFLDQLGDPALAREMRSHLVGELRALTGTLDTLLERAAFLALPRQGSVNKLAALGLAARAGLPVPATLLTTERSKLQEFKDRHGRIVTKSAAEASTFQHGNTRYSLYTVEVDQEAIDRAPARFFPSLLQEMLVKDFEVRTFYLSGELYSMAIFSQLDSGTTLDFRHYNFQLPNRMVPYDLPPDVAASIRGFMAAMALETGSIDLVHTRDGRHVFLEVNPAGQFKMVSEPCNYRLEKKVAEHLIALDHHARR
jgi:ATP-GRASP peptide maturase of grasp-with-spasm system